MIIRINGAHSGIKDYLEKGQMKDRFFDRDTLDQRLVLCGDLEKVDDIINQIDNDSEKYFHITLSFKEDHIDDEILKNITQEFRDYYFQSYGDDEISFYAEAHLPKLKSYYDKHGELVTRKPHVHIVVPKINLKTGDTVSYQERYNIKYVDAFQEYVNCKYGLASPKDNPRVGFNKKSEMISRYKGDEFTGVGKVHKTKIFNDIISKNIQTRDLLVKHLEDSGYKVHIRNRQIEAKSYINIKHPDDAKGVNLKEFVFSNNYLSLSKSDKLKFSENKKQLTNKNKDDLLDYISKTNTEHQSYLNKGFSRPVPEEYSKHMETWTTIISDQRKYVDRKFSKKQMAEYKHLTVEQKISHLQELKTKFYNETGVQNNERPITLSGEIGAIYRTTAANNLQSAGVNLAIFADSCERLSRDKVSDVGTEWRWQLGQQYAETVRVSQERHIADVGHNNGERQSSRLNALSLDYINSQLSGAEFKNELVYLRKSVRGDVLLELTEKTHGIIPEKYTITSNSQGEERIKAGDRNLSTIDFCRQELNLNMADTVQLLRTTNLMQREIDRERGWHYTDNQYLSNEYKIWLKDFKSAKDKDLAELKSNATSRLNSIKEQYKTKIQNVKEDPHNTRQAKEKIISTIKMDRLLENRALYAARSKEFDEIKSKYNLDMQESYRTFLAERATSGDAKATLELRRLRIDFEEYQTSGAIKHVDRYDEFRLNITHKIDTNGIITYFLNDAEIMKDIGKRIDLISVADKDVNKLALDLAMSKFGNRLELQGTDNFKRTMVDLAVTNNSNVTFKDEFSEMYRLQRIAELKIQHAKIESLADSFFKDNITKTAGLLVTDIVLTEAIDSSGKCYTVNVITVMDNNTQRSYELSNKQITGLVNNQKLNIGDVISIDGSKQNEIVVDRFFWQKYTADVGNGVLVSDYIKDNQIIFELPSYKQAKYSQEYFKINQDGIAEKLKQIGYEHGDLVSIKPTIDAKNGTIDYNFEILNDGSAKQQARVAIRINDIQEAKQAMTIGENTPTKVIIGEVVEFGNGEYKGRESTYISIKNDYNEIKQYWNQNFKQLIDDNKIQVGRQCVVAKTHDEILERTEIGNNFITAKFNVAELADEKLSAVYTIQNRHNKESLQSVYSGVIVDFGKKPFNESSLNNSFFVTIKDINGHEKTLWGRGVEQVINNKQFKQGDGVLFSVVDKQTFASGITQNIYDAEKLPKFEELYNQVNDKKQNHEITRQSYGEVIEAGTITKHGATTNFIKVNVGSRTISYWDNNLPVAGVQKGDGIYVANAGKIDVTVQIKQERFDAKEICQNMNARASQLVRKNEMEFQRKEMASDVSL